MKFFKGFANIASLLAISSTPAFIACGDDNSPTSDLKNLEYADIVESSYNDLPKCISKREGLEAYVKDEKVMYVCEDGEWVSDSEISSVNGSSSSKKKDKNGDDDDSDDSGSSKGKSSSSKKSGDSSSEDGDADSNDDGDDGEDDVYYEDDTDDQNDLDEALYFITISGFAQAGIFVQGSPVKFYEVTDTRTLETGREYQGQITFLPQKGDRQDSTDFYLISQVNTSKRFAIIEVKGIVQNNITNILSPDTITLKAIVDINQGPKNVNLFTHLEYERVVNLLGKGMSLTKAKKKAFTELIKHFDLSSDEKINSNRAGSEFLDFNGKTDYDGVLCASSLLSLNVGSMDDFSKTIKELADDFKTDGKIGNKKSTIKAADFFLPYLIYYQAKSNNFQNHTLRNMDLKTTCRNSLKKFIEKTYGIDNCENSENWGKIYPIKNEFSSYVEDKTYLYCTDSGTVTFASDLQKDTYGWEPGEPGEFKTGDVTGKTYAFTTGAYGWKWRETNEEDLSMGVCTRAVELDKNKNVVQYNGNWYFCTNYIWRPADDYITSGVDSWPAGEDGEVKEADINSYIYDETMEQWVLKTWSSQVNEDYGGCTQKKIGQIFGDVYCDSSRTWNSFTTTWNPFIDKDYYLNPDVEYSTLTDPRDKQTYKTVVVGDKEWMAQSLNYKPASGIKTYCYYFNEDLCKNGGRFYTWEDALKICPEGWHLPSEKEWTDAVNSAPGSSNDEKINSFKSTYGWRLSYKEEENNGTNTTGMTFLPIGYGTIHKDTISWRDINIKAIFWTTTESSRENYVKTIEEYLMNNEGDPTSDLLQVRCVRD